jgi:hypothetical protein
MSKIKNKFPKKDGISLQWSHAGTSGTPIPGDEDDNAPKLEEGNYSLKIQAVNSNNIGIASNICLSKPYQNEYETILFSYNITSCEWTVAVKDKLHPVSGDYKQADVNVEIGPRK